MKDLYLAFNCNFTNHDWSISILDTIDGIFNIQLERIDRLKHSPKLNDGFHGKLREFLNQRWLWNYHTKKYFVKVFKYINWIYNFTLYNKIYIINKPLDFSTMDLFKNNINNIEYINYKSHHIFHATSWFYASNFKESAVITILKKD